MLILNCMTHQQIYNTKNMIIVDYAAMADNVLAMIVMIHAKYTH